MIQSFPKSHSFLPPGERVSFNTRGRLIGNAVPVLFGEFIGNVISDHVKAHA